VENVPSTIYRVGGVILQKELVLAQEEETVLIRYTLLDAHSPTKIRLQPFLAFRNVHELTQANMDANTKYEAVPNGIKMKLYNDFPYLFMQLSRKSDYTHAPDWHYNVEYQREKARGYAHHEDLLVPGIFEFNIKKGESVVFSASLEEVKTVSLTKKFDSEVAKRSPRDSYYANLENSAQQFIVRKKEKTEIISGFPWFFSWGRGTFISLPGITLAIGDSKTCKSVLDTMSKKLVGGLFKNTSNNERPNRVTSDTSLWYIYAVQAFAKHAKPKDIWKDYGTQIKQILDAYLQGMVHNIKMHENGLIYAGNENHALTWMDAKINGKYITPRTGYAVEVNALWYNAVQFALEMAKENNDTDFINQWQEMPELIQKSFIETFWYEQKQYLFDYVNGDFKDVSVRPNQIIAAALPYSVLDSEQKKGVVDRVKSELLTERGLRSLSPKNPDFDGICEGNELERAEAYFQGSAWPWLLSFYAQVYLELHEKSGLKHIEKIYNGFEEEMNKHGIGSISELYDGNPPFKARGEISKAWSVGALLLINKLIKKYKLQDA
jgi:predicted glycogen debranching enzyme